MSHRDHHSVVVVIDNKAGVCGKRVVVTLVKGWCWCASVNTGECACVQANVVSVHECG